MRYDELKAGEYYFVRWPNAVRPHLKHWQPCEVVEVPTGLKVMLIGDDIYYDFKYDGGAEFRLMEVPT